MNSFIKKLLNLRAKGITPYDYENVHAIYLDSYKEASEYIKSMESNQGYTVIEPTEYVTKTRKNLNRKHIIPNSKGTHQTIGREYDKVLIPLDSYYYNDDGKLSSNYTEYYPYIENSLLLEGLSRVKKELLIVVINNIDVYNELMKILFWKQKNY